MAEIKMNDMQEIKNSAIEGFREIKPENGTTASEAKEYWNQTFESMREYRDDHGEVYRVDDSLVPNKRFEIRGYTYETDDQSRVISAEGKLKLKEPEKNRKMDSMDAVGKGDERPTDDRGHSIAHRFDGSDGIENLTAMDSKLNRGDYKRIENTLADAVKDGADVYLKVEQVYESDSHRPSEYRMIYTIDGEKTVVVFKNERGD